MVKFFCQRFFILTIVLIGLSISGCNSGNRAVTNDTQSQQAASPSSVGSVNGSSAYHLPQVDLMTLDYGLSAPSQNSSNMLCSADNSVCASLNLIPSAQYAPDAYQDNAWITPNSNVVLSLTFNSDVSQDFHLSDIYNDFESSSGLVGHIAQIDSSKCDNLVKVKNSTCQISLAYNGDVTTEQPNKIHIIFKWNQGQSNLDYTFEVKNKLMTVDNLPIVNMAFVSEPLFLFIRAQENSAGSGINFNYSIDNQVNLLNYGTGTVPGFKGDSPTISVALSKQFSTGINSLYYTNSLFTDCRNNPLPSTQSCLFRFYYLPESGLDIASPSGRFVFSYYEIESDNGVYYNKVSYTQRFMMSIGNIQPTNYSLEGFAGTINLHKQNINNQGLSYSPVLSNFKLVAKYEPYFDLAIKSNENELLYGYGDFLGSDGHTYLGQELAQKLQISYDPECFNSGFDPRYNNDLSYRSCTVTLNYPNLLAFNKPLSLNLYASYDSQTDNSHVEEFIGDINFNPLKVQAPCNVKNSLIGSYDIQSGAQLHTNDCYFVTNAALTKQYELLHGDDGEFGIYSCDGISFSCSTKIWSSTGSIGSDSYTEFSSSGSIVNMSPGYIAGMGFKCQQPCTSYWTAWISDPSPYDTERKFRFNDDGTLTIVKDGNIVWSSGSSNGYVWDAAGHNFTPVNSNATQSFPW